MRITFRAGDPFAPSSMIFEVNLSVEEINAAFKKGQSIIGLDLYSHFGSSDELTDEMYEALFNHIEVSNLANVLNISVFEWIELYLKIAKLGNPNLKFEWADSQPIAFNVGGEGILK